jgi:excisionase family DNA binding protein
MTAKEAFRPAKGAYTIKEAAAYLGLCERQIRNLITRGLLRKSKALRAVRIPGADVETFLERTA